MMCALVMMFNQWPESDAGTLLASAPWHSVVNLLAHMDAAACKSPCQIHALRRVVQEHLYPRVRHATAVHPVPVIVRVVVARLQAWLVAGILRAPVAVCGTGFFAARASHMRFTAKQQNTAHLDSPKLHRVETTDARTCSICGDTLAIEFNDDMNAWVFSDAVRRTVTSALIHIDCLS